MSLRSKGAFGWQKNHLRCRYMRPWWLHGVSRVEGDNRERKKITFPSAPPISTGSWATTLIVCASCVLPVRNSPYTTVWIMSSYWLLILNDPCSPSLIDWVWNPPVIESESKSQEELHTNSPPRIASTDLLPVLMNCTVCRFSWTSRPVANEDP